MEILAEPLECLLELRFSLENGSSMRISLQQFLRSRQGLLADQLKTLLTQESQGQLLTLPEGTSPLREALLEVIWKGLKGEPCVQRLKELEAEMIKASHDEVEGHIRKLPFLVLLPLVGFQLPAFLLLLLGPILFQLLESLSQ